MSETKAWRRRHPRLWAAQKQRYYARHRYQRKDREPHYCAAQNRLIVLHGVCDVALARQLHRSVAGIQVQRVRLRAFAKNPLKSTEEKCAHLGVTQAELAEFISRARITDPVPAWAIA